MNVYKAKNFRYVFYFYEGGSWLWDWRAHDYNVYKIVIVKSHLQLQLNYKIPTNVILPL